MNTSFNEVSRHPVARNGALRTIGSVNDMDELAAHMVGASLSARCHAGCPTFEPRCTINRVPNFKSLCSLIPPISSPSRLQAHGDEQNWVKKACHISLKLN